MTTASDTRRSALGLLVPAGTAVLTWVVLLVLVAYVASFGPMTITRLFEAMLVAALVWPVYRLAPWRSGLTDRVRWWLRTHWPTYALAVVIVAGTAILAAIDGPAIVLAVLRFPVETVELFRLSAFVQSHAGAGAAAAVLFAARLLLQALWALLLAALLHAAGRGVLRR